jgi:hypothetical protein
LVWFFFTPLFIGDFYLSSQFYVPVGADPLSDAPVPGKSGSRSASPPLSCSAKLQLELVSNSKIIILSKKCVKILVSNESVLMANIQERAQRGQG